MMTADEILKIAQAADDGRYLMSFSDWRNRDSEVRRACEQLVMSGKARWLGVSAYGGGMGPGIELR